MGSCCDFGLSKRDCKKWREVLYCTKMRQRSLNTTGNAVRYSQTHPRNFSAYSGVCFMQAFLFYDFVASALKKFL